MKSLVVSAGGHEVYLSPADRGLCVWFGVVRRSDGSVGALGRFPSGAYVQFNAGTIRTLDQRAVVAAAKRAGVVL